MPDDKRAKPAAGKRKNPAKPQIEVVEDPRERQRNLDLVKREKHLAVPFEEILEVHGYALVEVED